MLQILRLVMLVMPGLIVRELFNTVTGSAQLDWGLWALIALLVGASLSRVTVLLSSVSVEWMCWFTSSTLMRKNLFDYLLERPGAQSLRYAPGEVISRLGSDVAAVVEYLRTTLFLIGLTAQTFVVFAILLSINPYITLVAVLPLMGVGFVVHVASRRFENYRRASLTAAGQVSAFLGEMFGAAQAIKVATAEAHVIKQLRALHERRRQAALKERLFGEIIFQSFFGNLANLGTGLIMLLAGQSMRAGAFTVGDFSLFVTLVSQVNGFASFVGGNLASYRQAGVSLERLREVMPGASPEVLVEPGPVFLRSEAPQAPFIPKTARDRLVTLQARGLTYHYPDTGRGIETIDLSLRRGSLTVVVGRIGSGKTTLLRVLLGLLPNEAGEIRWNGDLVENPASFFVPPRVAYTPQVPWLFSGTLRDNILMGLPEEKVDLAEAIRLTVMEQDLAAMDSGLDTRIGVRGVRLSGGQIQRTAAARTLVREPELLVFDDLSTALDVETERTLWERIFQKPGITCLAVSHRRPALYRANHIVVLMDGRVEAEGMLDELLETCQEMRRIWRGDMGKATSITEV